MNFDDNDPAPKPKSTPLATGWYPAMVEEARDEEAKSSGKPRTAITFKVAVQKHDGTYYFRKVWMLYAWHVGEQKAALKKLVEACGIVPKGAINPAMLIERKVEVYLTIQIDPTGKYPDKNVVGNVRAVEGSLPPVPVSQVEDDIPF